MITLRQPDFRTNIHLEYFLEVDKRTELYAAARDLGINHCSRCIKQELADLIRQMILQHTDSVLQQLPLEELQYVKQLVEAGPDTCMEVPIQKDFYFLQRFYLVVSYEDQKRNIYHLVMPDEVREAIAPLIDAAIEREAEQEKSVVGKTVQLLMENVQKPLSEDNPTETKRFLPIFTATPPLEIKKGDNCAYRVLTPNIILITSKLQSDLYFNLYYLRMPENTVKMACCFGDVFNSFFGGDVLKQRVMPTLPKKVSKQMPVLDHLLYEAPIRPDAVYLNTIGFEGNPKQWFLMKNINDPMLWLTVRFIGPANETCETYAREINRTAIRLMEEVASSENKQAWERLQRFLGLSLK